MALVNFAVLLLLVATLPSCHPFTIRDFEERLGYSLNATTAVLDMSNASPPLQGPIPLELGSFVNLTKVDLSGNNITGGIPPELGRLVNVTSLILDDNHLSEPIPKELAGLIKLRSLSLSNNSLSEGIPIELGSLSSLKNLDLGANHLSGPIPKQLAALSNLTFLFLNNNSLSGEIPIELGALRKLYALNLAANNLTGNIPPELGDLAGIFHIDLSLNKLTGSIPGELGKLPVQILDLQNNSLSGQIPPQLGNLSSLFAVDLSYNNLDGPIPPEIGDMGWKKTSPFGMSVYFQHNRLSGPLPAEFRRLVGRVLTLNLGNNEFSGPLPFTFDDFPACFAGVILGNNNFSGPFVLERSNFSCTTGLILNNNSFSGPIPAALGNNASSLRGIDLSNNRFTGPLPPELGKLKYLWVLGVSNNSLSGPIPPELGALSKLTTLALIGNNFSGEIPPNLTHLEVLDVSRNPGLVNLPQNLTNNAENLTFLGMSGHVPAWVSGLKKLRGLVLRPLDGQPSEAVLDLSHVPNGTQFVAVSGNQRNLSKIVFWEACNYGCTIDLVGTGARLSRGTRREICLGKISVFLSGDRPLRDVDALTLTNSQGTVSLLDPLFLDKIDLGPGGRAYTGVSFPRVQEGNLCRNPESRKVVVIMFSVFAGALLLGALVVSIATALRRTRAGGKPRTESAIGATRMQAPRLAGAYIWGLIGPLLTWGALYTDIRVLLDVRGAWPQWVILGSILASYISGALLVTELLPTSGSSLPPVTSLRMRWIWPPPEPNAVGDLGTTAYPMSRARWALLLVAWPLAVPVVPLLDFMVLVDRVGFHVSTSVNTVYSMRPWYQTRSLLELAVRTVPQIAFQTTVYLLGNSRATRFYVDEIIFVSSIGVSLVSLLFQLLTLFWEAAAAPEYIWITFWRHFRSVTGPWTTSADAWYDDNNLKVGSEKLVELPQ
ncbi:LRR receptor-like serine/threonine-protein kinase FLS2 [Klebsormidium nitens]|uniref:LRR receptor-like serine/threonine-protein kinase FLS2 n=1 Tax=Klebsormidium nitens TaxID=105231 RepID=A0A1Y1HPS4_KLENI|nr:LRR receptor-like serine/threonine-protein kinase FLS2 [Klebsormidium nitens]|eukprot:GAQ78577.1 LRR receptor-like serine/threonine-protein kinase FLS2 [Klebsormidium nitens]